MTKYIVRYGAMRLLGFFSWAQPSSLFHGTRVIIHTGRGQEVGIVLCEATEKATAGLGSDLEDDRILRIMTSTDENEYRQMQASAKDEFLRCQKIIRNMNIIMDLVRVERIFGGERVIVYYVAEGRIDFRELVKVLAAEFQTRIEMKQIGVRDETKLLADIGDCGREVCCNSWLVAMPPVSMKMAKLQKATLDPTKISGRCGRLKCCLRYEYDSYHEISQILPPIGRLVTTPDGQGRVLSQELLAQKVQVELMDHSRKVYDAKDIKAVPYDRKYKSQESRFDDESSNNGTELDLDNDSSPYIDNNFGQTVIEGIVDVENFTPDKFQNIETVVDVSCTANNFDDSREAKNQETEKTSTDESDRRERNGYPKKDFSKHRNNFKKNYSKNNSDRFSDPSGKENYNSKNRSSQNGDIKEKYNEVIKEESVQKIVIPQKNERD